MKIRHTRLLETGGRGQRTESRGEGGRNTHIPSGTPQEQKYREERFFHKHLGGDQIWDEEERKRHAIANDDEFATNLRREAKGR